jgi:hypothetical protein
MHSNGLPDYDRITGMVEEINALAKNNSDVAIEKYRLLIQRRYRMESLMSAVKSARARRHSEARAHMDDARNAMRRIRLIQESLRKLLGVTP